MSLKKIAVLGMGLTGISVYNYLADIYELIIWDDNKDLTDFAKATVLEYTKWDVKSLAYIVVSPGIALKDGELHILQHKAQQYNVPIITDIDLFIQHNPHKKYIAITGTNGKSTTVALCEHFLKSANCRAVAVGNIGNCILNIDADQYDYIILELSSYQLERMQELSFFCSAILNIQPDHLDYHGGFSQYQHAKYKIFQQLTADNYLIINNNLTESILAFNPTLSAEIITVDSDQYAPVTNADVKVSNHAIKNMLNNQEFLFPEAMLLKGLHNKFNITIAYIIAKILNIADDDIKQALLTFKPLAHRQELIACKGNIRFINDSKATNLESTMHSLLAYHNIYLILGGIAKIDNLDLILDLLISKVSSVLLIGSSSILFANILKAHNIAFYEAYTLSNAVNLAYQLALVDNSEEINIVLSPACASFDQFKSFADRGQQFCQLVAKILNQQD